MDDYKLATIDDSNTDDTNTNGPTEVLLQENPGRFVMFPIKHPDIWEAFQTHRKAFWMESELDLSPDLRDWETLTSDEQYFIKMVLAFFAASDGIVLENLGLRFFSEVQIPEARAFYAIQMFMETIHSITYSQLIDTYIRDAEEKTRLFNAIENFESIKKKGEWALKWIQSSDSFATRLIAFAAVEGIFFSGSFCCIYWLNESGKMPGLCKSNEFIARDEGLHTDFACMLYNKYIENRLPESKVHELIAEAVEIEIEFITQALPCRLLGINADSMTQYIKYVSNRLLRQLGYATLYPNISQPFSFMDRICLEGKTNFFEQRVTEYQMEVVTTELEDVSFDTDF